MKRSAAALLTVGLVAVAVASGAMPASAAPPGPPVIVSPTTGTVTDDSTPFVRGTTDAGTTAITLMADPVSGPAIVTGPVSVAATVWGFDGSPLPDGRYTLTAVAWDASGNQSALSNAVVITVDAALPDPPVITSPSSGTTTIDTTPPVSGTMTAGTTAVTLTASPATGASIVTGPSSASGTTWALDSAALPDGTYALTVVGTDAAGNRSAPSDPVQLTVAVAVAAPVITSPSDGITADARPPIAGTAEPRATSVAVLVDGAVVGTAPVVAAAWAYTPTSDLAQGIHRITARARDAAGDVSVPSAPVVIIVDTGVGAAGVPSASATPPGLAVARLPVTGADPPTVVPAVAAVLLVLGAGLLFAARRRAQR